MLPNGLSWSNFKPFWSFKCSDQSLPKDMVGCQIDSVIGATLERKGLVNKKTTNLLATCSGAILAYLIILAWNAGITF